MDKFDECMIYWVEVIKSLKRESEIEFFFIFLKHKSTNKIWREKVNKS